MSFRYASGINKPGFNPLGTQTSVTTTVPYLYGWGRNNNGELGLGNTTNYSSPKQVGALTDWLNVSGTYHTVAVKSDGTLWTCGLNTYGQLGLGNTTNYSSPKQVGSLTAWSTTAAGSYSTFALKTDGTLWSWGRAQTYGQLGLGNTTNYSSPKQVGALTNWLKIACANYSTLAIKTDGTLWSWGRNDYGGLLGLNNTTNYSSPKQVGALTNWKTLFNDGTGSMVQVYAIKTDGTLWSWGVGVDGGLGLGNTTYYSSPKQVGALTTWLYVSGGSNFGIAAKTDNTLWTWGKNTFGQLGDGTTSRKLSPIQVGALTNWLKVSAAGYRCGALKTNGTLWTWGRNGFGQLGLGNTTDYSSPKQVGSLTTWLQVSASNYSTIALLY